MTRPDPDAALEGGFRDAPVQAAQAFRALLEAMSRPGRVQALAGAAPPAPLTPAAGALALTLCDAETPIWLAEDLRAPRIEGWLRFHCGAPLTEAPEEAAFAFGTPAGLGEAAGFALGAPDYPDRSATLVVLVAGFEGAALRLSGPGVKGEATLPLGAAAPAVARLCAANAAVFPQGRDLFLVAADRVAGLPRSARVTEG